MILLSLFTSIAATPDFKIVRGGFNYSFAKRVFANLNRVRSDVGVGKLKYDATLTKQAMKRAAELSVKYAHTRPNGLECSTAYSWNTNFGENIDIAVDRPSLVMRNWLNSEGHRENIYNEKFTKVGIGCFYNDYVVYYWVQAFSSGKCKTTFKVTGLKGIKAKVALKSNKRTRYCIIDSVPDIKTVSLEQKRFIYDDKTHKAKVVVKDAKGKSVNRKFYHVQYPDKIKDIGDYYVIVNEIYHPVTHVLKLKVKPRTPDIVSFGATPYNGFSIEWTRVRGDSIVYEVEYSKYKDFNNSKTMRTYGLSKVLNNLDVDTNYYIHVRAFVYYAPDNISSGWSKTCVLEN